MKLPNGERAIVDIGKLQGTALIRTIPVAETRHVCLHQLEFAKRMRKNSERPSSRRRATRKRRRGVANPFGQRYLVDFDLVREGRTIKIRSTWIVRAEEDLPRLTSCYVL